MSLITIDFETYYDNQISLKKLTTLEYVSHPKFKIHMVGIKIDDKETKIFTNSEIRTTLEGLFTPKNTHTLLCHNTAFDGLILQKIFGLTAKNYADTQLMFSGMAPYLSASLDSMTKALFPDETVQKGTELSLSMGIQNLTATVETTISAYCKNDVEITRACYDRMLTFFPTDELKIIHETLSMWIEPRFLLDTKRVETHLKNIETDAQKTLETAINEHGISKTTLASNPRFAEWLQERSITPPTKINPKGNTTWAFAKDDLAFIQLQYEHPELQTIWGARKSVKSTIEKSRAERLLTNAQLDNNNLRVPLKYYGAATGRYSGKEKINLQNLKRGSELRRSLIAPDNEYVYVSDLSQIEARVNAWISGEDGLLAQFHRGEDIYSKFASLIYKRPIDRKRVEIDDKGNEFKPDFTQGFVGKIAILGLGYGMSGDKFRETLAKGAMGAPVHFSEAESKEIVYNVYRKTNRQIVRNWATGDKHIKGMCLRNYTAEWGPLEISHQRILLPNGMYLNYPQLSPETDHMGQQSFEYWNGRFKTNIYGGKLVENIVQAMARIIVMEQALNIIDYFKGSLRLALQVHDELIFTGPKNDADNTMQTILEMMSIPPKWCANLPTTAEGGYAQDYSK